MSESEPIDEFDWVKYDVATFWSTSDMMALDQNG